ncbi:P-type conjugative transfer protein TrbL [Sphingobium subterraneum]|uniref:Type IV secretion system protein TrbL n=1 Tax=Sphingobium subterraneum TaxID=627688 RepID=A0A841JA59_9SPHN|nr:P-type conjugative transfer protein TrbL [Sphingobium subterraneum]MBB6125385.1 type IV secretion system protein TrbL [Sphingobium subterraneum]
MNNLNIIDQFLAAFIAYIDSGFGLLGGDVSFLSRTLIALDITLAGLFWTLGGDDHVLGRFVRKILYIGAFAFILNNFNVLADIIFRSFAQAGLTAGGGTITAADLLKPGRLAGTGFSAAWPLLNQVNQYLGFTTFFDNFLTIIVLLIAWLIVILAFFILAVQMFVCLIEFKLTSLAGFILVPFALWNRTSFLAERVLGNVVSSGIKVMVLAVIVGIGSNYFTQFTTALQGQQPDIGQAMSLVLASLALFGLGIFGPGIASGLVAGAPQLGAGAAFGTALGAGGIIYLGGASAIGAGRGLAAAGLGAIRAGTAMGSAASTAYTLGQEAAGSSSVSAGVGGLASAASGAANAAGSRMSAALGLSEAAASGRKLAFDAMTGRTATGAGEAEAGSSAMPGWARAMKAQASNRHHSQAALHVLGQGTSGGHGANPDLQQKED